MARDPIDQINQQIRKQQEEFDNPDPDGLDDVHDIDEALKDITGDAPRLDESSTFLTEQIEEDEQKRGSIPPQGSDANSENNL